MIFLLTCIVIDSGVSYNHPLIDKSMITGFTLTFDQEESVFYSADFDDKYGHGTAIYNILQELKDDVNIINVRLSSIEDEVVDENALISALEYIEKEYHHIDVINLSLGSTICDRRNDLYDICKRFDDNGTVILSAFDNEGSMSFPAAFDCVIGVVGLDECKKVNDFIFIDDTYINIGAKGGIQRLAWKDPNTIFMNGNSFACAHATKQTLKILLTGVSGREAVLREFKSMSIANYKVGTAEVMSKATLPKEGRIALFPFNKEMHSLIRFSDKIKYKITKVYDLKYFGNVSSTTDIVIRDDNITKFKIENIDDIDYDSFDCFVFGHFCEAENVISVDYRKKLLNRLCECGKSVISFDDIERLGISYPNVYCPKLYPSDVIPNRDGKLFRINKPVLGVFGTSSSQGKFTLQLKLRNMFLDNEYSVGQIGTEPHSELFGMDYVFPMGYNSSVYLNDYEIVRHLNSLVYSLCDKEIIIVGSQANTIPYDYGNVNRFTFSQHAFFMGTMPDAVVLVINPYDDIEYINNTIKYLESFGFGKVIAIVVYPLDIDQNWKRYTHKKHVVSKERMQVIRKIYNDKVPIYLLGCESDEKLLFDRIIDWLS